MGFPSWLSGKESTCQCRRHGFNPWVRKISWRREWQPTLVFLPGEFHEQRSPAGYSPWGCKESDTTEHHFAKSWKPPQGRDKLVWDITTSWGSFKARTSVHSQAISHSVFFEEWLSGSRETCSYWQTQLTPEQCQFPLCRSTYIEICFSKHILGDYNIHRNSHWNDTFHTMNHKNNYNKIRLCESL